MSKYLEKEETVTPVYPRSPALSRRKVEATAGTPSAPFSEPSRLAGCRNALAWAQPAASLRDSNSRQKTQPPAVLRQALGTAGHPALPFSPSGWASGRPGRRFLGFPGDTPASRGPSSPPLLKVKPFDAITKSEATLPLAREGPLGVPSRVCRPPRRPASALQRKRHHLARPPVARAGQPPSNLGPPLSQGLSVTP